MTIQIICKPNYIRVTDGLSYVESPYIRGIPSDIKDLLTDLGSLLYNFFRIKGKKVPSNFEVEVVSDG